jgi:hypothetical protein
MLADPLSFENFLGRAFTVALTTRNIRHSQSLHTCGSGLKKQVWTISNRNDLVMAYGLNQGSVPAVESPFCPSIRGGKPCPRTAAGKTGVQMTASGHVQGLLYSAARRAYSNGSMTPLLFPQNV